MTGIGPLPRGDAIEVRCRPTGDLSPALLGHRLNGRITVARAEGALLLPVKAVHRDETGVWCLVPSDRGLRTERVWLTTGLEDGSMIVIEKGLSEGDEVRLPEGGE